MKQVTLLLQARGYSPVKASVFSVGLLGAGSANAAALDISSLSAPMADVLLTAAAAVPIILPIMGGILAITIGIAVVKRIARSV